MKLERPGLIGVSVLLAMGGAALVFRDLFLETALAVVAMAFAAEGAWVLFATRRPESRFRLSRGAEEPDEAKTILYPGEESSQRAYLVKRAGGRATLNPRVNFLSFEPEAYSGAGRFAVNLRFRSEYAGEYSADEVGLKVSGPLGLFSSQASIPFRQRYMVYPRVLQVAASTVKLLGRAEIGETPIEMPGIGSEYYEMRAYQPGDDYRNVNWKASARGGELVVVEHMREVGSSFLLVLDARAPGFRETDWLASTFLSIANSLGAAGMNFGVIVHDGRKVIDVSSQQDPRASLAMALKAAIGMTRLEAMPEFLELVPVGASSRYAAAVGVEEAPLRQIPGLRRSELRSVLRSIDPWATAARYVRETQTKSVVYVSGLFGEVQPLIELAWEARHYRDCEFTVANPCDRKEEGATPYLKLAKALYTAGVGYQRGEPVDIARKVLTA